MYVPDFLFTTIRVENKPTEIYNIVVKRAVVSKMAAVDYDDSLYIILIIYY